MAQRHDHRLARVAAPIGRAGLKPLGQGAVLLEPEKTPRQLDHAAPNASVTGARKAGLAALLTSPSGRKRTKHPPVKAFW